MNIFAMKRTPLIATFVAGIASAHAADLASPYPKAPVAPADSWTGFYLGAGAGFRSGNADEQTKSAVVTFGGVVVNDFISPANCASFATPCGVTQALNNTAARFSPYAGYNWQVDPIAGHWLLRADYRYSDFGTITNTDLRTVQVPAGGVADIVTSYRLHVSTQAALAGIAYKF